MGSKPPSPREHRIGLVNQILRQAKGNVMLREDSVLTGGRNGDQGLERLERALQVTLGSTAFLAGLDKFTQKICYWDKYLAPRVKEKLPISGSKFMKMTGVIEMAVGAGILSGRYTRASSYLASAWLVGIAGNLFMHRTNYKDIAIRDLNMALEAFTLATLAGQVQSRRELRGNFPAEIPATAVNPELAHTAVEESEIVQPGLEPTGS